MQHRCQQSPRSTIWAKPPGSLADGTASRANARCPAERPGPGDALECVFSELRPVFAGQRARAHRLGPDN